MKQMAILFSCLILASSISGCVSTAKVEGTAYNETENIVRVVCQYESSSAVSDVEKYISAYGQETFSLEYGNWYVIAINTTTGDKIDDAHLEIGEDDNSFDIYVLNYTVWANTY